MFNKNNILILAKSNINQFFIIFYFYSYKVLKEVFFFQNFILTLLNILNYYYYSYPVRTLWAYAGSYCVMFAQGNPLGKKPAPLSRLNRAIPAQESVVPSKRRLSLILISIVLVTVVFCGCVGIY